MKKCDSCGRTYSDSLNFCLDDGQVLSGSEMQEEVETELLTRAIVEEKSDKQTRQSKDTIEVKFLQFLGPGKPNYFQVYLTNSAHQPRGGTISVILGIKGIVNGHETDGAPVQVEVPSNGTITLAVVVEEDVTVAFLDDSTGNFARTSALSDY
jgi:hypothetical protein